MVSERVKRNTPSITVELSGKVQEMKERGEDIIGLNAGEPDFDTPKPIREACKQALDEGKTRYVGVSGIPGLRQAICRKLERDNRLCYEPSQICVSTGAKQALNNAVMAITNPGDEVILPTPCWVSYVEIVKLYGAIPVKVPTKADYHLDLTAIRKAVTKKTRAVIVNTPNNPTGAVYGREELEGLAELAVSHDFYIISDEIYEKLIYGGEKHYSVGAFSKEAYDHTILINGLSKSCAMTGWRIGYSAGPADVARGIAAIQSHITSNSTTFVQYAAIQALEQSGQETERMVQCFQGRREYMQKRLSEMPGITCQEAKGAFYLLPDISACLGKTFQGKRIETALDLCSYLLEEAKLVVVPGEAFFAPNTIRISYTSSMEDIIRGMDRLEQALKVLHTGERP